MTESLTYRLHELHIDHLLRTAEVIRYWPEPVERREQAERHIREAMFLHTIGRISQAERALIFSILSFAMPDPDSDCGADSEPVAER